MENSKIFVGAKLAFQRIPHQRKTFIVTYIRKMYENIFLYTEYSNLKMEFTPVISLWLQIFHINVTLFFSLTLCIYICMYVYIYMHVCIHIYMHVYVRSHNHYQTEINRFLLNYLLKYHVDQHFRIRKSYKDIKNA